VEAGVVGAGVAGVVGAAVGGAVLGVVDCLDESHPAPANPQMTAPTTTKTKHLADPRINNHLFDSIIDASATSPIRP
jgi:hypothetical protein